MINAKTQLCCIIGNPVKHSLSPQMYNAAFAQTKSDFCFMAFKIINLARAIESLKMFNCRCIVVTIPYKQEVIKYIDKVDETAKKIGAVNCIINNNGYLTGTNTDCYGALQSLEEQTKLKNKKVAILGAGGAARAIIYGLKLKKANVFLFNRTLSNAKKLAEEFNLTRPYSLNEQINLKNMDIIINATSVGMEPNQDQSPVAEENIHQDQLVFDIVYTPHKTQLLKIAKARGAKIVYGYKMVLYGGIKIFELTTNKQAPISIMDKTLLKNLN